MDTEPRLKLRAAAAMRVSACAIGMGGAVALLYLVEAHRVDARHHVVAQIRRFEAAGLQAGDDAFDPRVDLQQARGKSSRCRRLTGSVRSLKRSTFFRNEL